MANADTDAVVARLRASPNAARAARGLRPARARRPDSAPGTRLLLALEVFQQSPADFYPYNSKYDACLRGQAS